MKNLLILFCLTMATTVLNAQTTGQVASYNANTADGGVSDALYKYALGSISDADNKTKGFDDSIEGSPYMSNNFSQTSIYYGDEKEGDLFYRYNAYNEEIEIKQQNLIDEPIRALGRDKKIKIMVNGKPMSFKTFIDKNGNTKNGYLTLIKDGEFKLYKRLNVTFKEAKKAPNSFVKGVPARFTQFTEYYLEVDGGNRIDELEMNNKKLINLVTDDKQSALKKYLKENKIKLKDESDIHQVINFLNS
ncbi:MAG: hypothetical protein HKP24_12105 [Croceitalea sp.]|nr:hypothetical protein [Croceitalea sp.]NNM19298.1 hypothetical protein [Croceitalea sp.]